MIAGFRHLVWRGWDVKRKWWLGVPVVPFYPLLGEGSPTIIDCSKKGTHILTSLLEDLCGLVIFLGGGRGVGNWG